MTERRDDAPPQLVHTLGRDVTCRYRGQTLFRYVYVPQTPPRESPKPYLHPVRTLAGNEVTIFRPHDHLWHTGIAMTWASLSGQNFWGGPTYVRDRGYQQLPNNGRIEHRRWAAIAGPGAGEAGQPGGAGGSTGEGGAGRAAGGAAELDEALEWITAGGERWIDERRGLRLAEVVPAEGYWSLDCTFHLTNQWEEPLAFRSPTIEGRPLAGYGGLFWRGPRSFLGGTILAAGGRSGPELMGEAAPWLAFVGRHDGTGDRSTLLFLDHPGNPRFPTKWFVRSTPYACASFALTFDQTLVLPPGQTLRLDYRIVIADGAWEAGRAEAYAAAWQGATQTESGGESR